MYDKLVTKVNAINISGFVLKTQYNTDKSVLKKINDDSKKIPDTGGLVKKTDYDTKITDLDYEIPSITDLATTAALNAVDNRISDVSNLVEKNTYEIYIKN